MDRRSFLKSSAALAALTPLAARAAEQAAAPAPAPVRPTRSNPKALMLATFSGETAQKLSVKEKFQMLRAAGFDGVEVMSAMNQSDVLAARDATGLKIASVCISTHWMKPLSDPNPSAREVGLEGLRQGLRDAKAYGADSVLLVPAIVNKQVSYADAYARSVAEIAKAVPLAESLGVAIAIENVWNGFLLSPREAAEYVDSFRSPAVRWHFDVGNIVNSGWPEQWIRLLGSRIAKIHVKEFSRKLHNTRGPYTGFEVALTEGDSDWPAVMAALDSVNYRGWMILEQYRPPGITDEAWLADLSGRLDRILSL